eukprot:7013174-Prymnesium_polylepis.1
MRAPRRHRRHRHHTTWHRVCRALVSILCSLAHSGRTVPRMLRARDRNTRRARRTFRPKLRFGACAGTSLGAVAPPRPLCRRSPLPWCRRSPRSWRRCSPRP